VRLACNHGDRVEQKAADSITINVTQSAWNVRWGSMTIYSMKMACARQITTIHKIVSALIKSDRVRFVSRVRKSTSVYTTAALKISCSKNSRNTADTIFDRRPELAAAVVGPQELATKTHKLATKTHKTAGPANDARARDAWRVLVRSSGLSGGSAMSKVTVCCWPISLKKDCSKSL